jgi:hypothetical protein
LQEAQCSWNQNSFKSKKNSKSHGLSLYFEKSQSVEDGVAHIEWNLLSILYCLTTFKHATKLKLK